MNIKGHQHIKIENSNSKIGFATTGGGSWKVWDRYITYNNKQLFHIGTICGTCNFFFLQLDNEFKSSLTSGELIDKLNNGLDKLDNEITKDFSKLFSDGEYEVLLLDIKPYFVFPNDPKDYFVSDLFKTWNDENDGKSEVNIGYYRGTDSKIKIDEKLFEFFIPLYQPTNLSEERIQFYQEKIRNGEKPTALAVGVLDVKESMTFPEINGEEIIPEIKTHWCFANYLIDGHHKIQAAARENKSITLLTFISTDASYKLAVDEMIKHYSSEEIYGC